MHRESLKVDAAVFAVAAVLVLALAATQLDTSRLYVSAFGGSMNDQVNHVGMARRLADTGTLDSTLVYPAMLATRATRTYVYMPGYHGLAATFYRLLGYSDFVALLPSMCAYVGATVLVLLCGWRLGGPPTGRIAAVLFLAYPPNVLYALTAMTESCMVAAVLLAFCGFLYLPVGLRPWLAPALLAVPFVVRETGALLMSALAMLMLFEPGPVRQRVVRTAASVVLSVILLAAVLRSDFASGRPPLQVVAIFTDNWEAYTSDAVAYGAVVADWTRLPRMFVERAARSVAFLVHGIGLPANAMRLALAGVPLGLALFAWRREPLGLATAAYIIVTAALHVFHFFFGPTGMRMLLPVLPLTALVVARLLVLAVDAAPAWARQRRVILLAGSVAAGSLLALEARELARIYAWYPIVRANDDEDTRFVESIGHDDRRLLVAPWDVALPYVQRHHPVLWSYPPANAPSLELLARRYDIGSVLLPEDHRLGAALADAGFMIQGRAAHLGRSFAIWRRPGASDDRSAVRGLVDPQ